MTFRELPILSDPCGSHEHIWQFVCADPPGTVLRPIAWEADNPGDGSSSGEEWPISRIVLGGPAGLPVLTVEADGTVTLPQGGTVQDALAQVQETFALAARWITERESSLQRIRETALQSREWECKYEKAIIEILGVTGDLEED